MLMRTVMSLVCLLCLLPAYVGGLGERLEKIDSVIQKSTVYVQQKELKISSLKAVAQQAPDRQARLNAMTNSIQNIIPTASTQP